MNDLFARDANDLTPLAERLRPKTIDDVIGQRHLLAPGKPLAVAFAVGQAAFDDPVGPARRRQDDARAADGRCVQRRVHRASPRCWPASRTSATRSRAPRLRSRQSGRATILFVDEVHRFNKAQQDAFLPFVEQGLLTFIGATTENPSFEVNGALLSRAAVYVLEPLSADELAQLLERARRRGDARRCDRRRRARCADRLRRRRWAPARQPGRAARRRRRARRSGRTIDVAFVEATIARSLRRFDKGGEAFYDQISALHKAVRGSDPDASLYWMCRMLDGGADPLYVGRRLIRMASEDIGLADPRALTLALDAVATYERLGSPEGELALAEAVIYLAVRAEDQRRLHGVRRGARVHRRRRLAAGAAAPAQRADAS